MHILEYVAMFFFLAAAVIETFALIYGFADIFFSKDDYSYIGTDGSFGIADFCDNGKGGLYCTEGGRIFTVKEFSKK